MYVKIYNQILNSSIADNRKLRHFFIDLLLCADPEGNVVMTKSSIAGAIRADISEVEWGLAELMKPDPENGGRVPDHEGRRIAPLEGRGYGWKILNYEFYRDMKSARELREKTAERVARWREKKKAKVIRRGKFQKGEAAFMAARDNGASEAQQDGIVTESLPSHFQGEP